MFVSTFLHLQCFILFQLRTCLYVCVSLCSSFPTNKPHETSFTRKEKKSNDERFFSYFCYEFLKPVWKTTANIPKGLLNLLLCFKVKCSHIKPCKWKPSSGPLNPRISSGTHSGLFPTPTCHGAQASRQPLLKRGSDINFDWKLSKGMGCILYTDTEKHRKPTNTKPKVSSF